MIWTSLPARGVWSDIPTVGESTKMFVTSLPARGVWIEIYWKFQPGSRRRSLPARGVWIEIS